MKQYSLIQKNEAHLWSKVYKSFEIGKSTLCTLDPSDSKNPNSNQLFYWGKECEFLSVSAQAKSLFVEHNCKGFYRKEILDSERKSQNTEVYMLQNNPAQHFTKDPEINFESFTDISNRQDFLKVMESAFSLNSSQVQGFKERMKDVSTKVETIFFMGEVHSTPQFVGGLFMSTDYWFLMNLGVCSSVQNQGFGKKALNYVGSLVDRPIVFRTANPILEKYVGPACGYEVVSVTSIEEL